MLDNRTLIFAPPAMQEGARHLAACCPADYEPGNIEWRRFPDGTPNNVIVDYDMIDGRNVVFMASLQDTRDYFDQFSTMYQIARGNPQSLTIYLSFYPTATMERPVPHGVVVTAETLARMLSTIPPARNGLTEIVIDDPHTEVLKSFFDGHRVRVTFRSFMPRIESHLRLLPNAAVVFPDKGARERFGRFFQERTQVICEKHRRPGMTPELRIVDGDPSGRPCVIIDDLVQTGGTLIECAHTLREHGALEVHAAFTHAVFPKDGWRAFTPDVFRTVHTTTSCPETAARMAAEMTNLKLTNVGEMLHRYLFPIKR